MYDESLSLACQFGKCDDCPENDDPDGYCACTHHIPDDPRWTEGWGLEVPLFGVEA